jgi:hypothetical protein
MPRQVIRKVPFQVRRSLAKQSCNLFWQVFQRDFRARSKSECPVNGQRTE